MSVCGCRGQGSYRGDGHCVSGGGRADSRRGHDLPLARLPGRPCNLAVRWLARHGGPLQASGGVAASAHRSAACSHTEPPAGYRLPRGDMVGVRPTSANDITAKACPGRPRRIVTRRLGLLDFVAARSASCSDLSQLPERSGLRRAASSATGHEIEQTQGSRCKAPTALSMRRGLPGHVFAACL